MKYIFQINDEAGKNENFRRVICTGSKSQLVIMNIKPGEEVGRETHVHVEQILYFLAGSGKAVLNNEELEIRAGNIAIVPPGTEHNFINTGKESLRIITVYVPPNHIDGRVHKTPGDAKNDLEDEAFGEKVE